MSKLQRNNLVAQSNHLVNARFRITQNEFSLLAAMISLLEPNDKEFPIFTIGIKEVSNMLRINERNTFKELDKVTDRLMKRISRVWTPEGEYVKFTWLNNVKINKDESLISLQFDNFLKPYLLELKKSGNFTQYRLGQIVGFKSFYTSRIYGLLVENYRKKTYKCEYSLDDFRQMMLGHQSTAYPLYKNFRNKVIDIAKRELSEQDEKTSCYKSDLNFDLQTRRTGRKISHLIFTIKTQQTKPIPKTKTETPPTANNANTLQIILDYEAIGVMHKTVQPYLKQRGEQALKNTLNKFNDDKAKGKITKSEQGYLAYLLRVNAGQETTQDKEAEQKDNNKKHLAEQAAKDKVLQEVFTQERETALNGFFATLADDEREYIIADFEASELFKRHIKSLLVLFDLYNNYGMQDPDIKKYFNYFIIEQYLDKTLNNFTQWKEKNTGAE